MPICRMVIRGAVAALALGAFAVPARAQTIEHHHLEALGSVRAVTEQSGTVIERHDNLPFGEDVNAPAAPGKRCENGVRRSGNERQLDHIEPASHGGSRDAANGLILSRDFNLARGIEGK